MHPTLSQSLQKDDREKKNIKIYITYVHNVR